MEITTSLFDASACGEEATAAPWRAAHSSAVEAVRFQTVRSKPARARFAAMREPMIPSPMKPTRSGIVSAAGTL